MISLRALMAEMLGTAILVATVIGSGIMAERLAGGNLAVALLGNTLATGAILYVLITILGPVSGAHFNPAVTFVFWLRREMSALQTIRFSLSQLAGGLVGMLLAHFMFELPLVQHATHIRAGLSQTVSEIIASFGLLLTILGGLAYAQKSIPLLVGLYISAGYWFTASTSFANPAVTIARAFTDSFSGIRLIDVPAFIAAQYIGAVIALGVATVLFEKPRG